MSDVTIHIVPTLVELAVENLSSHGTPIEALPDFWLPVYLDEGAAVKYAEEVGVSPDDIETDRVRFAMAPAGSETVDA